MSVPEDLRDVAAELNRALMSNTGFYGATRPRSPHWYGRLLSDIVLAVERQEIRYVTANFTGGEGRVIVLTDRAVVNAVVSSVEADEAQIATSVVSRKSLVFLAISARDGVFDNAPFVDWPGAITIRARYKELGDVEMPLDGKGDLEALRALYVSLRDDLH